MFCSYLFAWNQTSTQQVSVKLTDRRSAIKRVCEGGGGRSSLHLDVTHPTLNMRSENRYDTSIYSTFDTGQYFCHIGRSQVQQFYNESIFGAAANCIWSSTSRQLEKYIMQPTVIDKSPSLRQVSPFTVHQTQDALNAISVSRREALIDSLKLLLSTNQRRISQPITMRRGDSIWFVICMMSTGTMTASMTERVVHGLLLLVDIR